MGRSHFGHTVLAHGGAEATYVYEFSGIARNYGGGPCLQAALIAIDSWTGQRLASRDARDPASGSRCAMDAAIAVAPPPPAGLQASVAGERVTLTWQASPDATHYEVEAGSAPGLGNLARFTTGDTSFTATNVPRGTYHVRVRALDFAGKGAYTADVVVTVP